MVTVLLLLCYFPLAFVPLVVPFQVLRTLRTSFPPLALAPLISAAMALLLAQPLTNWLGYAVVLLPLAVTFASLSIALVGARLALHEHREGRAATKLGVLTLMAAVPFLLVLPFLISAALTLMGGLAGA